jgi:hypothetical protein
MADVERHVVDPNKDGLSGGMTEQDVEHKWFDGHEIRGFWVYPRV